MNRFFVFVLLGLLLAVPSWAQPTILAKGVVNSASYMLPDVPGGSIAQGSIFSIFGSNLGSTAGETLTFPLPGEFGGISIAVTQGETTVAAYPLTSNGGQINAIMPSNAPLGEVEVTVSVDGQESNSEAVTVVTRAVGIYSLNQAGSGPGVIQNVISGDNRPVNSLNITATPGMVLTLWATGLGAIDQSDADPPPIADIPGDLVITVGGEPVTSFLYAGRSNFAGVDQINFRVPNLAPEGCFVPVTVQTDNGLTSNTVTMAIQADGAVCSDPANPAISGDIPAGGSRVGTINISRTSIQLGALPAGIVAQTLELITDSGGAEFQRVPETFFDPTFAMPAVNSCSSYVFRGSVDDSGEIPDINEAPQNGLDAGAQITVAREADGMTKAMDRISTGLYAGSFASISTIPGFPTDAPFLEPGTYQISGPGGPGGDNSVGPFSTTLELGPSLDWLNRDEIESINRSQGVTLRWSGGDPANQLLFITGSSVDTDAEVFGVFFCIASLAPGEFTVPGGVMANLPVSSLISGQSAGFLTLGTTPNASGIATFTADGLDQGVIFSNQLTGKLVGFE